MTGKTVTEKEAEVLSAGIELQNEALALLLAEIHALGEILSGGTTHPDETPAETEARVEADFDNMPV